MHFRTFDLGEPTPQKILNYMREVARQRRVSDPESFYRLSRTHVSSHLQKYRQRTKAQSQSQKAQWTEPTGAVAPSTPGERWPAEAKQL